MITCKDCDKRHPGCHDNCCTYQAALADRIARKQWLHRCGLQTSRGWYRSPYGYKRVKGGEINDKRGAIRAGGSIGHDGTL